MAKQNRSQGSGRGGRRGATPRWSEAEAAGRVEAWRASGLSLAAWCRHEGLRYERLRRWRQQLERTRKRRRDPQLLPVQLVEPENSPHALELELPRGLRLRVAAGFDATALARLLGELEAHA